MSPSTRLTSGVLAFAAALALGGCVLPPKDKPQLTPTPDTALGLDRKSTRLNSSHPSKSRMPSSA